MTHDVREPAATRGDDRRRRVLVLPTLHVVIYAARSERHLRRSVWTSRLGGDNHMANVDHVAQLRIRQL